MNKLIIFTSLLLLVSCSKEDYILDTLEGTSWYTIQRDTGYIIKEKSYIFVTDNKLQIECREYIAGYSFDNKLWRTKGSFIHSYSFHNNQLEIEEMLYNVEFCKDAIKLRSGCYNQLLTKDRVIQ